MSTSFVLFVYNTNPSAFSMPKSQDILFVYSYTCSMYKATYIHTVNKITKLKLFLNGNTGYPVL